MNQRLRVPYRRPLSIFRVTRFGQSGNPDGPYHEYEIDSDSIMAVSFAALGIKTTPIFAPQWMG